MTKQECNKKISELIELTQDLICSTGAWDEVFNSEEYKNASDELDRLLDYRLDNWPDDYDERSWGKVIDQGAYKFGEIGRVGYVSHSDVQLFFMDGTNHYYHAMSLEPVKSSPELRELWGEIPLWQYSKKRRQND